MLAEHQHEAADRAVDLLRTRGGVLLADDVGLGKSFVAAAVMRRMQCEAELIVPAALVEQWSETLSSFAVDARILTHDRLLTDRFAPRRGERLVVVDEAHAFRNPRTQRYAALARRAAGAKLMLVTATPVCNSLRDLEALVGLLARDDLLADAGVPSIDVAFAARDAESIERIVAALVIRRDRSVLPEELRFGELERRVVRHPVPDAHTIDELRFPLVGGHAILRRFLWRRLESSEAALEESLRRQLRFYERALACIAAGRTLPKRDYRRAFAHEEDRDAFQQVLFWDLFAPPGEADPNEIRAEMARLQSLLAQVRASPCEKRRMLADLLAHEREPTLIFTGSAATARDLGATLHCAVITARERSRDEVLRAFRAGTIDRIVSTDMAAEGLNLQRAGVVVHYDLPWNPVKLDQRNGRAHRIGQHRASVRAIYFIPQSRETKIIETIARKNRIRRAALKQQQPSNSPTQQPTLRPRLTKSAAYLRLNEAAHRAHLTLPDTLARRHPAGIESIMREMSREYLDRQRLDDLLALIDE
ncbi:MAG TPA: DEAD/DEAH box helicase [Thermoanaerobaculia bacterium]|nr:DEAD/DEAH box helicase [Thermoanaerobaculia bacterium]